MFPVLLDVSLELHHQISSVFLFASVTARRWSVFYRVSLIFSEHNEEERLLGPSQPIISMNANNQSLWNAIANNIKL